MNNSVAKLVKDILIVEDSKAVNKMVANRLKEVSDNIDQAFTLGDAINLLAQKSYDLIILDLHLPDGEGLDLVYKIQSLTETKIIVFTSLRDNDLREEFFRSGVLDYIAKGENISYSITEIIRILEQINANKQDKILIVDDSRLICRVLTNILEPRNYEIATAYSAKDAIDRLSLEDFNLIILDMELPDMHGTEVLKIIREQEKYLSTPVIVLSGTIIPDIVRVFLKNGANDYIKKPFIYEEFVLKIDLWNNHYKKDKMLKSKTRELKELNQNLENIVEQKVKENREKDGIIMLKSRQAQMGEMISMIAHQWKQPLNALSASIVSLEMKLSLDDIELDYSQDIFKNINNYIHYMSQTIDDFRDFFKPEKDKKITNLDKIFQKAYKIIGGTLKKSNVEIKTSINVSQNLKTYENELVQVVMNIFKNALDVLKEREIEQPAIFISIEPNFISIEDNAGGISEDFITKIFDPYFSTKSKNGTGIGLYMSKIIVEEHCEGELVVENSKNGAKFILSLPLDN